MDFYCIFLSEKNNVQNNVQAQRLRIRRLLSAYALVPMGKEENTHQAENTEHSLLKKGLQGILMCFIFVH